MKLSFPAMRGKMGHRTYYSCLVSLSEIPHMFQFRDWIEFTPEDREQRLLNKKRIPDIAKYIIDNEDGYLFSSITASYKGDVEFASVNGNGLGTLSLELKDAHFVINDGQHRCAAIKDALKENPELGEEDISVLLFPYENKERVQQMFSDLNRFVVKTSKSLNITFDNRDPMAQVTLRISETVPVFRGMVEKDAVSVPIRSPKLFALSALYDANRELLTNQDPDTDEEDLFIQAYAYWITIAEVMTEWDKVKTGEWKAVELRQQSICTHSVVLRALGSVGSELMEMSTEEWERRIGYLKLINWKKKNRDWETVCMIGNTVVSNRQARLATKAYIKMFLELPLNDTETKALPESFRLGLDKHIKELKSEC